MSTDHLSDSTVSDSTVVATAFKLIFPLDPPVVTYCHTITDAIDEWNRLFKHWRPLPVRQQIIFLKIIECQLSQFFVVKPGYVKIQYDPQYEQFLDKSKPDWKDRETEGSILFHLIAATRLVLEKCGGIPWFPFSELHQRLSPFTVEEGREFLDGLLYIHGHREMWFVWYIDPSGPMSEWTEEQLKEVHQRYKQFSNWMGDESTVPMIFTELHQDDIGKQVPIPSERAWLKESRMAPMPDEKFFASPDSLPTVRYQMEQSNYSYEEIKAQQDSKLVFSVTDERVWELFETAISERRLTEEWAREFVGAHVGIRIEGEPTRDIRVPDTVEISASSGVNLLVWNMDPTSVARLLNALDESGWIEADAAIPFFVKHCMFTLKNIGIGKVNKKKLIDLYHQFDSWKNAKGNSAETIISKLGLHERRDGIRK